VGAVTDPHSAYRRADRLADRGRPGDAEEAEALLRPAISGGHRRSLVRLAQLLLYQTRPGPDSGAEAEDLLLAAVERGVPRAANTLGLLYADAGNTPGAIEYLRRAVADGDRDAEGNLAHVLHEAGDDAEAFTVLRAAAENGNDSAHRILSMNLRPDSDLWRSIDAAFHAARDSDEPPRFTCATSSGWRLDLPADIPARRR
jgi:TPR repeat protein